ncbi:MAG TPA: hypothetical protein VFV30_12095 [Novosphingobium sp.]|nr:hypothetical protein [Novosphingobium sp.]
MLRFALPLVALALGACSGGKPDAPATDVALVPSETAPAEAATPVPDAAAAVMARTSQYTSLKDCKVIDDGGGEDWSVSRCAGLGGITLMINYGDARDDLELHLPGKQPTELGLPYLAGGGFNTLGDTVEWRGTGQGKAFRPSALIVRNHAVQDPEHPERPTALLAVIDLTKGCVVAQIKPQAGQNEAARALADGPPRPCLDPGRAVG